MSYFFDDFNRADSATVGNNWTAENSAVFQILSNKLRGTQQGTLFYTNQLLRPSGEAFADGQLQVNFQFVTSTTDGAAPQIHGRCQGTSYNTFYLVMVNNGTFYLGKSISGTWTSLSSQAVTVAVGTNYRMTLKMVGSAITAILYNIDTSTTLATLSVTNTAVTGSGPQAISMTNTGSAIDYDNFFATSIPTVAMTDAGTGSDAVVISTSFKTVSDSGIGTDGISIRVSLALGDAGSGNELIVGPPTDQIILQDRFDATLNQWILDQTDGTVSIQTVNFNKQMVLNDASASGVVSATSPFSAPTSGKFNVEADMNCAVNAKGSLQILDAAGNVLFSVLNDGVAGQGTFSANADTAATFTWAANTPKMIVFVVNVTTRQVLCYYTTLDGTKPATWVAVSAAKNYSGTPAKIRFITDPTATGQFNVDDVTIYKPDIFCLGDSNTAGHDPTTTNPRWNPNPNAGERTTAGTDQTHNYPYKFGQKFGPPRWVADRGVDADQSADNDGRVTDCVINQGAKSCSVMIGTNDISNLVPVATIETNIASIVTKLKNAGVRVILCSVPPRNAWNGSQNTDRSTLNAWISSYCTTNGHTFADVYTAVRDPSFPNNILPAYNSGDGLHFSHAGLQAIADTVYTAYQTQQYFALLDGSVAVDGISVKVRIPLADAGHGVDGFTNKGVGDTGHGADAVIMTITAGAVTQDVYNLVLTRLASKDYTAPDNAGIGAIKAKTDTISWQDIVDLRDEALGKWVLDPAAKTLTLYRADGVTVLKTFNLTSVATAVPAFIQRTPV